MRNSLRVAPVVITVAVPTLPLWKPAAKRIRWVVIASNISHDALRRVGIGSDQVGQLNFDALPLSEVPAYLARINATVAGYEKYGGLNPAALRDRRVLRRHPVESATALISTHEHRPCRRRARARVRRRHRLQRCPRGDLRPRCHLCSTRPRLEARRPPLQSRHRRSSSWRLCGRQMSEPSPRASSPGHPTRRPGVRVWSSQTNEVRGGWASKECTHFVPASRISRASRGLNASFPSTIEHFRISSRFKSPFRTVRLPEQRRRTRSGGRRRAPNATRKAP